MLVFKIEITYVKEAKIFPKRYCGSLLDGLQSYKLSKNCIASLPRTTRGQAGFDTWAMGSSSKFDEPQLCCPLTNRDAQFLFGNI